MLLLVLPASLPKKLLRLVTMKTGVAWGLLALAGAEAFQTPRPSARSRLLQVRASENTGEFAWLVPYLDLLGIKEGKKVFFGPIPIDVGPIPSPEESERRRIEAAQNLMNIDAEERARRAQAARVMLGVTAVYMAWSALIADDGSLGGHVIRFASVVPIFLALGYRLSAETGL